MVKTILPKNEQKVKTWLEALDSTKACLTADEVGMLLEKGKDGQLIRESVDDLINGGWKVAKIGKSPLFPRRPFLADVWGPDFETYIRETYDSEVSA